MLPDTAMHQAAGLHSYTPARALRLLPVLSPEEDGPWLEMLWQLCSSLQRLGYPVAVLDGIARESRQSPGLDQLLRPTAWAPAQALDAAADRASLAVLPAAQGLARLSSLASAPASPRGDAALQRLEPLFRAYAVLVLYAPAQSLAPLLRGSACVPLVMTGPGAQGLVRSYLQLKHLALHADVRCCTVASITAPRTPAQARQTAEALAALQHSAQQLLGQQLHTTAVAPARAQDIQRLALQLLENGCTIDPEMRMLPLHCPGATAEYTQRSH